MTGKCRGFAAAVVDVVADVVCAGVVLASSNWSAMAFAAKRHRPGNERTPRGD